jgi:hypothetical protein
MVTFSVNNKALVEALNRIKVAHKLQGRKKKIVYCEVTVKTDCLEIQSPGIFTEVEARSSGPCKFSVAYLIFSKIVSSYKSETLNFTVDKGRIYIENLGFSLDTTFFNDDTILRSIQLPINFAAADLLTLNQANYSPEEIHFNKMDVQIEHVMVKLVKDLMAVSKKLQPYHITYNDLKNLVCERLNLDPEALMLHENHYKANGK